jgi:hypothetical protein
MAKGLAIMLGAPKGDDEDAGGGGLKEAASDILEAIQDNDAVALATAFRLAYEACMDEHKTHEDDSAAED